MKKSAYLILSKILRQELKEKHSAVTQARLQESTLKEAMHKIETDLQKEKQFLKSQTHLQHLFESFKKNLSQQQARLTTQRKELDKQLQHFQEEVATLFQKVKSYEIPYERLQHKNQQKEKKEEQKILDEVSAQVFERHQKNDGV